MGKTTSGAVVGYRGDRIPALRSEGLSIMGNGRNAGTHGTCPSDSSLRPKEYCKVPEAYQDPGKTKVCQ